MFVLKSGSVAWAEREKGGRGQRGRIRVEVTEGGEGGAWRDGCQRRAAGNSPRPAGTGGAIAA
jgi:hypothetical protein